MKYITLFMLLYFSLSGCAAGHKDFIKITNKEIGSKVITKRPVEFETAGKLIRGTYAIGGKGLTHISEDEDSNLIYHIDLHEHLSNSPRKEWVGKCAYYYVVDPDSYIIKSWDFEEGSNPLSCRTWN